MAATVSPAASFKGKVPLAIGDGTEGGAALSAAVFSVVAFISAEGTQLQDVGVGDVFVPIDVK